MKKTLKFITLLAIMVLLVVTLTGCTSVETSTGAQDTKKGIYEYGEEATLDGATIKVVKIEKSNGTQYEKPDTGKEFVIVTVQISNTSSKNISYNVFDYKIQNSQGQITSQTIYTGAKNSLNSGELAPGGTITGEIPFETTKGDSDLTLIYEGNFWTDSKLKFKLQ